MTQAAVSPALLELAEGIRVPVPEDGLNLRYSQEAVDLVLDFFSLLVFGQNEWAGQPFTFLPWEMDAVRQFYGVQVADDDGRWVRYRRFLYTEIPKKNGKSELAAALGLYHLFGDGELNAEVYLCAADRDNASIVFRAAVFMLETAPWTAKMIARGELKITKSKKQIEYRQLRRAETAASAG